MILVMWLNKHDFNKTVFINFAMENHDKYGIVSSMEVWGLMPQLIIGYVDALVKDFKMSIEVDIVAEAGARKTFI